MSLFQMSIETAFEIVLSVAMLALKVFSSDDGMIKSDVEFEIDLVVEGGAAIRIVARKQAMVNL